MSKWDDLGLNDFLTSRPTMRIVSYSDLEIGLVGDYRCRAGKKGQPAIDETYTLSIRFPPRYPDDIPVVTETGGRITRHQDFHTYKDGSFCLGSDIRIKAIIRERPRLTEFADRILDPFLYSISCKIKFGAFPYGELAHGEPGLIDDYEQLFGITGKKAVLGVLNALGKRKRIANKLACPCACGHRLGKCDFRFTIAEWRTLARRRWFRHHLKECFTPVEKVKHKKPKRRRRKKQR